MMWREAFEFITPGLAVFNGVLAVIIATLSARRSTAKFRLAITALALGAVAVGITLYGQHYAEVLFKRQQAERSQTREQIETFILEGRTLLSQIQDAERDLPTRPADEWAQRSEFYLRDKLGEPYVARFRKDVSGLYGDAVLPETRMGYWRAVRNRVVNLEMVAAELPELTPPRRQSLLSAD